MENEHKTGIYQKTKEPSTKEVYSNVNTYLDRKGQKVYTSNSIPREEESQKL